MVEVKTCYVCMYCGMTHYTKIKPKKCKKCGEKFTVKHHLNFIQCGNKLTIGVVKTKWWKN